MWNYSQLAIEHYLAPKHVGIPPSVSITGEATDPRTGTSYAVGMKLSQRGVIERAGFEWRGSAISVASTSFLLDMVQNRNLEFAARTTPEELGRLMDGLPEDQLRIPPFGLLALRNAHGQWQEGQLGRQARFVCTCNAVMLSRIHEAIAAGARTPGALARETGAGTGCGTCVDELMQILRQAEEARQQSLRGAGITDSLSPAAQRRLAAIEDVLDAEVRPGLALDGGGIEVVSCSESEVTVRLWGACRGCASRGSTMRYLVEDRIHALVDPGILVIEASG